MYHGLRGKSGQIVRDRSGSLGFGRNGSKLVPEERPSDPRCVVFVALEGSGLRVQGLGPGAQGCGLGCSGPLFGAALLSHVRGAALPARGDGPAGPGALDAAPAPEGSRPLNKK